MIFEEISMPNAPRSVAVLSPDDARARMSRNQEGAYTILDVRQEWEYEEGHIPGARLIPLPELTDRLDELDPGKETFVYCARGGRSHAASTLLAGLGFTSIHDIQGGFMAWQGQYAVGPETQGLLNLRGDETPEQVLKLAYRMEGALEEVYTALAAETESPDISRILTRLAAFEAGHQQKIFTIYQTIDLSAKSIVAFERELETGDEVEGAIPTWQFLEEHRKQFETAQGAIETAMSLEAQAQDLYLRCSHRADKDETRRLLLEMAEDEKSHLRELGAIFDLKP
jgi:rhodanese-related sulfurtransferase/rubrerythrin